MIPSNRKNQIGLLSPYCSWTSATSCWFVRSWTVLLAHKCSEYNSPLAWRTFYWPKKFKTTLRSPPKAVVKNERGMVFWGVHLHRTILYFTNLCTYVMAKAVSYWLWSWFSNIYVFHVNSFVLTRWWWFGFLVLCEQFWSDQIVTWFGF